MRLSEIYPANLRKGMMVGGHVVRGNPRRPFQPIAHVMVVESVAITKDSVIPTYVGGMVGTPLPGNVKVVIIEP